MRPIIDRLSPTITDNDAAPSDRIGIGSMRLRPAEEPRSSILALSGVALAFTSAAFAILMLSASHEPYIVGMEQLAIFAQPNRSSRKVHEPPVQIAGHPELDHHSIDYTPTASIHRHDDNAPDQGPKGEARNYEILAATEARAWVRFGADIREVRVGDSLPGGETILMIVKREGDWRLITKKVATRGNSTASGSSDGRPKAQIGHGLIFDK